MDTVISTVIPLPLEGFTLLAVFIEKQPLDKKVMMNFIHHLDMI